MNDALNLREALARADLAELDDVAQAIGREAAQAALARMPVVDAEAERQLLLDAALADAIETVARHRMRLGRRVCSRPDGTVTRQVFELLLSMAGPDGGADGDPSFQ